MRYGDKEGEGGGGDIEIESPFFVPMYRYLSINNPPPPPHRPPLSFLAKRLPEEEKKKKKKPTGFDEMSKD